MSYYVNTMPPLPKKGIERSVEQIVRNAPVMKIYWSIIFLLGVNFMSGLSDFADGFSSTVQPSLKMLQALEKNTLNKGTTPSQTAGNIVNSTTKGLNLNANNPFASDISRIAKKNNLNPKLLTALIQKESNFNPNAFNKSSKAAGLLQINPITQKHLGLTDPFDPIASLEAGAGYLATLKKQFGSDKLALAAYNAGPGNVQKFGGVPPFKETQNYVSTILASVGGGQ